jgi:hypothetical protein
MTDVRTVTLYKLLYAFYKIRKNHLPPKSLEITTYHKSTIKSDCPVTYKELSTLSNVNHQERSIPNRVSKAQLHAASLRTYNIILLKMLYVIQFE